MGLKELWSRLTKAEHDHAMESREALDTRSYDDIKMDERIDETFPGGRTAGDDLGDPADS